MDLNLINIREELDEIDKNLVELYKKRLDISIKVAKYKLLNNKPVLDKKREEEKLDAITNLVELDYEKLSLKYLYEYIMLAGKNYQYDYLFKNSDLKQQNFKQVKSLESFIKKEDKPLKLLYKDDFELALLNEFKDYIKKDVYIERVSNYKLALEENIYALECNSLAYLILPISNLNNTCLTEIYDLLALNDIYILGKYIKNNFFAKDDNLNYIILSKQKIYVEKADIVSLVFDLDNSQNLLYNILAYFALNKINMISIQSKTIQNHSLKSRFFIDIQGNLSKKNLLIALSGIKNEVDNMKILGNY